MSWCLYNLYSTNLAEAKDFAATGPDDISICCFESCGVFPDHKLYLLFQLCVDTAATPSQRKIARVVPIFERVKERLFRLSPNKLTILCVQINEILF